VRSFVEDEIEATADQYLSAAAPDDWNMEGLVAALHSMGLDGPGTTEDELWDLGSRDAIAQHLHELAQDRLEARERETGETEWALVERLVLLRTIDSLWVEHLTELDDMRRGIGLRGYAQQDPLNEFRREAFRLYEELRGFIRHQVATTIFRVTVTRQPAAQPLGVPVAAAAGAGGALGSSSAATRQATAGAAGLATAGSVTAAGAATLPRGLPPGQNVRAVRESLGDAPVNGGSAAGPGGPRPGYTPSGERIGRNDACYCGSGLKYKKCHGR
jgi:preprotein translocase subunit SecA